MNDLQEYIIWKINSLSDEKNWSINRLAIEANLTQSTLSNIISKKAIPNIKTIDAICHACNISISAFFKDYSDNKTTNISAENEDDLLNYYRLLEKSEQYIMLTLVKNYVDNKLNNLK